MPDIESLPQTSRIRRENLLLLLREFSERQLAQGVAAKGIELAFAASLEISASTLSQLKSSRNMGDKRAAQLERHAGLDAGWMDEKHLEGTASPGELAFLEFARLAWRGTDAKGRRSLMQLAKRKFVAVL